MQILVLFADLPNQNLHPVFDKPSSDPGAQRSLRASGIEEIGMDRQIRKYKVTFNSPSEPGMLRFRRTHHCWKGPWGFSIRTNLVQ